MCLADGSYGKGDLNFRRPEYSLCMAHTLSVASKLAYEDVAVVKYELEKAGYDVENTFKAIGYKVLLIIGIIENVFMHYFI